MRENQRSSLFKHCTALTMKNKQVCVEQRRGWHQLLSHLSLLDNVVRVTAREAGALQKVHDIIFTATITEAIKEEITQIYKVVISCDCTVTLTSPSSCLRSTGPFLHR